MTQQNSDDETDTIVKENIKISAQKQKVTICLCNVFLPDLSTLVKFIPTLIKFSETNNDTLLLYYYSYIKHHLLRPFINFISDDWKVEKFVDTSVAF